ncbi:Exodeoxyribonuclease 7 large subunit isoform 2 [Actinidia chinensis var. chinensis]|uniref:Biogenesis of lysosome-related organelles complex 1 subunit 7 n=1 Tax=Actinidia chinensis var. chinensis TaxID=1590841 RepID=A0A2R6P5B3_ACTCC|nr:Exodeoxyribonuclease 7 large subunit isoform 2 [Actinidia chinensis var. chinensis]
MSDETLENHNHDSSEDASVVVLADPEPSNAAADSDADASATADDAPQPSATTAVDGDEINACDSSSSSSSSVAEALSSMLSSVIRDFDSRAEDAGRSQDQLSFAIDRLTRELDQLLEDAPLPFIMQHAAKVSGVRKRVSSLNTLLKSIQRRLDNIDRMYLIELNALGRESSRRKSETELASAVYWRKFLQIRNMFSVDENHLCWPSSAGSLLELQFLHLYWILSGREQVAVDLLKHKVQLQCLPPVCHGFLIRSPLHFAPPSMLCLNLPCANVVHPKLGSCCFCFPAGFCNSLPLLGFRSNMF